MMKRLITMVMMALLVATGVSQAQTARVQIIHNAPDAQIDTVNVFIGNTPLLTDFAFRTASPFVDASAGVPLEIKILPQGVTDTSQALFRQTLTLMANETYVVVANGVIDQNTYTTAQTFGLDVFAGATEQALAPTTTDILVHHGSPDAPPVDILENAITNTTLINNAPYGGFVQTSGLPAVDYRLQVLDSTQSVAVGEYSAPLATLSLADSSLVVFASGFLNTLANPGPSFKILVALPNGQVLELPQSTAKAQVIHNVADPAAATVDVWVNTQRVLNDVDFRQASPFLDLAAQANLTVSVTAANATDTAGALISENFILDRDTNYVVVAAGVSGNPIFDSVKPLGLYAAAAKRRAAVGNNTDVLVFHGATDAGAVSVNETSAPVPNLIPTFAFGDFSNYLNLATADYELEVVLQPDSVPAIRFAAPLNTLGLQDSALVVLASGFVDSVKGGQNLPGFGLYAALPSGGNLIPLPVTSGLGQNENRITSFDFFPNPANDELTITGLKDQRALRIIDLAGHIRYERALNANENKVTLDVSNLAAGVYLLQVGEDNANRQVRKIVIQ